MPDSEHSDSKYSVTKIPLSLRLSVSENEVDLKNPHEPDAPYLFRGDLLDYIERLESNAKEFIAKNNAILDSLKAQASLTETSSSSRVNASHKAPESLSGAATDPNATVLPTGFPRSASVPCSESSLTVASASATTETTDHSHFDLPNSDGDRNNKDVNVSPLKPDPIVDNADNEIEPELGNPVNQDDIDYEEYLLLGEELQEFGWYRPSLLAAKHELTVRSQIMPWMNNAMCLNAADEVLTSIEEPVLQAIMTSEGNLNRLVAIDLNVAQTLQQNERRCLKHQPSVYISALTHDESEDFAPFAVDEARDIAGYAYLYLRIGANQEEVAFQIDHAHNPKWREEWTHQGARFFIQVNKISTGDYDPINQKRKVVLTTFACALDKIATQAKQAGKLTISARRRQQLLSRMARAYYFTGGLNSGALACAASVAHMRSDAVTGEQEGEWWVDAEKYMNDNAGYRQRFGREMRRRDALFLEEEEEVG
ncbi:hypothetical protein B5807_09610 [Epicoccum nigrum]|uniref:Uncharacterized protein n=1 Tax=Epicoccum nigrum TaxID=105696 RepID=A0A1Y2LPP8_EPING|nr:hypothetical protein B5807_09610 [Epicoccum nigrum]